MESGLMELSAAASDQVALRDDIESKSRNRPWLLYGSARRWLYLAILFGVTTSNYFDYFVLSIVLEPIKREFGVSDTQLGLLSGVSFALFYIAAALPIARWADRGNRRTVIGTALAAWSIVTAACGLVQTFWQLVLARMLIGAVEPGGVPPAQSLVTDYFPPERRATALIVLSQGGAAMGYLVGIGLGGYVAARYGWRWAFFVAGAPGLLLAVAVWMLLPEPRTQMKIRSQPAGSGSSRIVLARLLSKRTYLMALVGMSIYVIFSYGIAVFLPSFMMRTLHATLEQVSATWGIAMSVANLAGALMGGWLADSLSRRDLRWYAWLPMGACALALPLYYAVFSSHSLHQFIAIEFVAEVILSAGIPGTYVMVQAVCGSSSRAMAMAALQFCIILFGGLGPLIAGAISDALVIVSGADSLRQSLTTMLICLLPAGIAFYVAGTRLRSEMEL